MAYFTSFLVINKDSWDALPADLQAVVQEAADQRSVEQLPLLQTFLDEAVAQFEERGVNVHEPSADELAAFQERMAPVYDWWTGQVADADTLIAFARENQ
jgi:TRAP-type C4-dicarboxylate transport system substrate-binding protein